MSPRVLWARFSGWLGVKASDQALGDEIETHLALLTQEHEHRGLSPDDARAAARRDFGGIDQMRADYRDQRGLPFLDALAQDLRCAFRIVRKDRAFACAAIVVLGVGIGINNMMFTIIYGHTLRQLSIDRPDRVLYVSTFDDRTPDRGLSFPDVEDLTRADRFAGFVAFTGAPVAVSDEGRAPDRFDAAYLTAGGFDLIGRQPLRGRMFTAAEDAAGAEPVALLGQTAWQSRYDSDPSLLGRQISINGAPTTVIGIIPDRSGFPSTAQVWIPLSRMPGLDAERRDLRNLRVFGRLREGVTARDGQAQAEQIIDTIARDHPDTSAKLRARVVPISERFLGRPDDPAWRPFMLVSFLVLTIACANVANLLLARAVLRTRELAIRTSLGASRRRVVRQLLIESAVLAGLGGTLGLAISLAGVRVFETAIPANALPYWLNYSMDARVFGALLAVSFASVALFGLVPALQASRTDVNTVLKDGGRRATARRGTRVLTTSFLAIEFALTVVLLLQGVESLTSRDVPIRSDALIDTPELITATLTLPTDTYKAPEQRLELYRQLEERLRAQPHITAASLATTLPLRGAPSQRLDIEGRTVGDRPLTVPVVSIGTGYFSMFGALIERGRDFVESDGTPGAANAIISQRFARTFFDGMDPIGHRIRLSAPTGPPSSEWHTIVGVAENIRYSPDPTPDEIVFLPFRAAPPGTAMLTVRSTADLSTIASALRNEVRALDPHLPLYRVMTMEEVVYEASWSGRVSVGFLNTLVIISLALAIVGLYAVTAYAVGQRSQEIGIRIALGAQRRDVWRLILHRAMAQVALGLVLGLAGSIAWDAAFSNGLSGRDDLGFVSPSVMLPVAAVLTFATLAACVLPARRASHFDPVVVLRHD